VSIGRDARDATDVCLLSARLFAVRIAGRAEEGNRRPARIRVILAVVTIATQ